MDKQSINMLAIFTSMRKAKLHSHLLARPKQTRNILDYSTVQFGPFQKSIVISPISAF